MEMSLDCRLQRTAKPSDPRLGQYHDNYVLGYGVVKVFRRTTFLNDARALRNFWFPSRCSRGLRTSRMLRNGRW